MKIIVAADQSWGIGNNGELLVRIPADMQRFQKMTMGKVVVMGRKTLESLPAGQPLTGRKNVVLTRQDYKVRGAVIVHSMKEVLKYLEDFDSDDVYIIGGESVYKQFLPLVDTVYVTKIDYMYQADTRFVNLDQMEEWELAEESDEQTYFNLEYYFLKYTRKT